MIVAKHRQNKKNKKFSRLLPLISCIAVLIFWYVLAIAVLDILADEDVALQIMFGKSWMKSLFVGLVISVLIAIFKTR